MHSTDDAVPELRPSRDAAWVVPRFVFAKVPTRVLRATAVTGLKVLPRSEPLRATPTIRLPSYDQLYELVI